MSDLTTDLLKLEQAMRLLFQNMKRPQTWTSVTARAGVDIDRPAAGILFTLTAHATQRYRLQDLATDLGIEAPSVTRKSQELEKAGYVKRVPDPFDKRAVSLQVTTRGKKVVEKLRAVQRQDLLAALSQWDECDREQFIQHFERFAEQMTARYNSAQK
jgi:DNA-binding MarR family transcriptional regulator